MQPAKTDEETQSIDTAIREVVKEAIEESQGEDIDRRRRSGRGIFPLLVILLGALGIGYIIATRGEALEDLPEQIEAFANDMSGRVKGVSETTADMIAEGGEEVGEKIAEESEEAAEQVEESGDRMAEQIEETVEEQMGEAASTTPGDDQ